MLNEINLISTGNKIVTSENSKSLDKGNYLNRDKT